MLVELVWFGEYPDETNKLPPLASILPPAIDALSKLTLEPSLPEVALLTETFRVLFPGSTVAMRIVTLSPVVNSHEPL